jgi:hypothetical protein
MNRQSVIFHLSEAAEELNRTLKAIEQRRSYGEGALEIAMGRIYHHLNTAWNGSNQSRKQFVQCTEQDFNRFRKFPRETEFVYLAPLKRRTPIKPERSKDSSGRRARVSVTSRTPSARRR